MRNRNPAVLWYWDDFIGGTAYLTDEEVGAYVRCLGQQWADGGKTTIDKLEKTLRGRFDILWPSISDKFETYDNHVYNMRLLKEIQKRERFCASRSKNRKSSKETQENQGVTDNHMLNTCLTYEEHMGNGNRNRNKSLLKASKRVNPNDVERVYQAYPSRCPISGRALGKCSKDKDKIRAIIGRKTHTADSLAEIQKRYIDDCKKTQTYAKAYSTFLNNVPDPEQFDAPVQQASSEPIPPYHRAFGD